MRIVIAGSGQAVSHWTPEEERDAPSPTSLRAEAARQALPEGLKRLGAIAVVRTTEDSVPTSTYPFGRDGNPPGTLARELGVEADELIYSGVGGQTPGALVLEMADRIHAGEMDSALVVGAEAVGAAKLARRAGLDLDWSADDPAPFTDRGAALDWISAEEFRHGLHTPAHHYGLVESALAHAHSDGREDHRRAMSELLAPFSEVAARNPFAQFPKAWDADALATPSPRNYPLADPYLRHHAAQDAVNQGAAVLLMAEDAARGSGLTGTYLLGGATARDGVLSRRHDIMRAAAMDAAGGAALEAAGLDLGGVDALDMYSCFPCAVWCGLVALGYPTPGLPGFAREVEGMAGSTATPLPGPLTVTGGLPFFGGPGNNYSLHAIASMHARLHGTAERGLVLANGGWLSKAAVVLMSGAPADYTPAPPPIDAARDERDLVPEPCTGHLEAFTFSNSRSGPSSGTALVRVRHTDRALATATGEALARLAGDRSPIGAEVRVEVESGVGRLHFA